MINLESSEPSEVSDAEHAASFPPNTPHSVINAFRGDGPEEFAADRPADPRESETASDPLAEKVSELQSAANEQKTDEPVEEVKSDE